MKNIAIFCDGTWNAEDSTHRTNVALLSGALKREGTVPQVPIYLPGVGTGKGATFLVYPLGIGHWGPAPMVIHPYRLHDL